MPRLTRWMIKASFIYLVLALGFHVLQPAVLLWGLQTPVHPASFGPVFTHLFLVGWVTLLIFGVVFWMFPKYSREKPRGSELLGWVTFAAINLGLVLRVVGEMFNAPALGLGWVLIVSGVLQWLGGLSFVLNTWPRVKEK
jgi:hypothetical protein